MRRNYTLRIPHDQKENILKSLLSCGLKDRKVENALWSLEGEGVYITMYDSGILLIQGPEAMKWTESVLKAIEVPSKPVCGCDEVGKGDIFGPIVLCCVVITPKNYISVLKVAPKDSKKLKGKDVLAKANLLRELIHTKCIVIMPERFNELYTRYRNVNRLMDDAYRKLIETLREYEPARIVVDKYSQVNPFQSIKEVEFLEKGERDVAVSVASIIAREKFLKRIEELEREYGIKIPLGGNSQAKALAKKLVKREPEIARKLIKLSFLD